MDFEVTIQTTANDLGTFYELLTPRIEADLASWYGGEARLIDTPSFTPRDWSFFFRYRVRVKEQQEKAILVKIRHARDMNLIQAIDSETMNREAMEEYGSLAHIQAVFAGAEYAGQFFAVRPLSLYEDLNAVLMEEAQLRPLRSFLDAPHKLAVQTFETHLEQAGRWLNIFHRSAANPAGEGSVFTDAMLERAARHTAGINAFLTDNDRSKLSAFLEKLYETFRSTFIPYRILHDDFNCANVFVTPSQQICSFDPKNTPGSMYVDLARFITDMETCRAQILTNGIAYSAARMQAFHTAFLSGYFGAESVDRSLLNFYRLLDFLGRWHETESRLADASTRTKLLYAPALPLMRSYFRKRLWRLAENRNFDF